MSEDKIENLLKKIKEYPVGRETSYVMGSGTDPVSLARRIASLESEMSIMIREVDKMIRVIHFVADEYNDKTLKELSKQLKSL